MSNLHQTHAPYLIFNFPILRQQMSGLQIPILHGLGNLKVARFFTRFFGRFFGAIFLRFLLLISSTGDSMIVSTNKGSSVATISCSTSCVISVVGISAISVLFRVGNIFLGNFFVSISFSSSTIKGDSFSVVFRLVIFFIDRSFKGKMDNSSSSSYFCLSCGNII